MDKIRPFEKLASKFQISNETAKYFLGRVQKCFKKEKPPHILIIEFIDAQEMEILLEPYDIAALMKDTGVWDYAMNSAPPILVDDGDVDIP